MAADLKAVRLAYVNKMKEACKKVAELNTFLNNLKNLYVGSKLSGTFVDAEMLDKEFTRHMVAADVATYTANLATISAAMTPAIIENMSKAVGEFAG